MDHKDHDVKRLSRAERISEEARRALEFGQVPKSPLSLNVGFRVEGLTATAPPGMRPPGKRFLELSRMEIATTREGNPLFPKESASHLTAQIEAELERIRPTNRAQRAGRMMELVGKLQIAEPNRGTTLALRRKVLSALFGKCFLQSEHGLSPERQPSALGGLVGPGDEGRE